MNRIFNKYFAALFVILNIAGSAYAASDEELYVFREADNERILSRVDFAGFGTPTLTDIVVIDETSFTENALFGLLNSDDVFYIIGVTNGTSKLYTLDTTDGDLDVVGTMNIDYAYHLFKNPADNTAWVSFDDDNDGNHVPEAVAQINLSDAQVDTDTIVSLPSPRWFNSAFFDAFGNLYGLEWSSGTSYVPWWFRVDLDTGAISPDCPPGGSFSPCWQLASSGLFPVTNPDTNDILSFDFVSTHLFEIQRLDFYETFMGATSFGDIELGEIYGASFAPNVQSGPVPRPPGEIFLGGMCG